MRTLFLVAFLLLTLPTILLAQPPFSLYVTATFAPPHNEPVAGDRVARYRAELEPALHLKWLDVEGKLSAWGVQKWRPSSVVGNGFPEAWRGSDWDVEAWRFSYTARATAWVWPQRLGLFAEHYKPINRHSWGGRGMERHYYLLTGVRGRLW